MIILKEGESVDICGGTIIFDSIWFDDPTIKADLSFLKNERAKPVSGGYSIGDNVSVADNFHIILRISKREKKTDKYLLY